MDFITKEMFSTGEIPSLVAVYQNKKAFLESPDNSKSTDFIFYLQANSQLLFKKKKIFARDVS